MLPDFIKKYARLKFEQALYQALSRVGTPRNQVEALPDSGSFADRKPEDGEEYWYFSGPLDEKTRPFCRLMLRLDKVFSTSEINTISTFLNYDVLQYKGSYNCRHKWVRFRGKRISTAPPTANQIRSLIDKGIVSK